MADMNIYTDSDIYAPVQRAQAFKEQQNALARQNAVRNALASSIDPATGRTNWQQAYTLGGKQVAPELQGMQAEEAQRITREDADYLKQKREQLEMYVNDQASYDAWVADVKTHHPYASFPPTFSPEVKDQLSGFSRRLELAGRTGTGFQTLTPEEEQQLGLPTGVVAQRGPKNDIKVVYKPNMPRAPGAGSAQRAPSGYRYRDDGSLEPIPGGPAATNVGSNLETKERAKREAAYPKASASYRSSINEIDTLIQDLNKLKSHKGLSGITGSIEGRLPNVMPNSSAAQALLDKIMARGQFRELQNMRNNSPTGGALGQVSDAENKALRSAFAALDQRQSEQDFKAAIDDAISQLNFSKANINQAYQDIYSYRNPSSEKDSDWTDL